MLTCYMCGETKPEADFAFADMAKGIRQRHCRKCHAAYRRAHYLANREEYIRREAARIKSYRIENRALMLAYLLGHPCVDCGETDPVKLDFDHRDPSLKRDNIGSLAARKPWRLVLIEIEKCEVRCANCHMRRTAMQYNWQKARKAPAVALSLVSPVRPVAPPIVDAIETTKTCTGCGLDRPVSEFPVKHKRRGTRGTRCRACRSAYGKAHYRRQCDKYKQRARAGRLRDRESCRAWLMGYLETHHCVDCDETDPVVLTFDHRDGVEKVDTVGALLRKRSLAAMIAEVAKCDVRCANCHRRRTAEQFHWSKWTNASA